MKTAITTKAPLGPALLLILSLLAALIVPARSAAETAQEILDHIKAVNDAREPKDITQKATMTIVDAGGKRVRDMLIQTKNYAKRTSKSVTFFLAPAELKDVGVLAWIYPDKDDDQWIYFPATERIRRLNVEVAKEGFGDSDFSYEDTKLLADLILDSTKVGTATLARQEDPFDGVKCTVIDFKPKREDSQYGRLLMWLDRADSTLRKMELYSRDDGALIKVLTLKRYQTIGNIPTPVSIEMATLKRGGKTAIEISDTRYNQGLSDDLFTQHALQRGPAS